MPVIYSAGAIGKTRGKRVGDSSYDSCSFDARIVEEDALITNSVEYEKAECELRDLQRRLVELQLQHPLGEKGGTKAGIRKLIARLHEELAIFEGSEVARNLPTTKPN